MAKLPSISDLIANPLLAEKLTTPQLLELNRQLLEFKKNAGDANLAGESPIHLAEKLSAGAWRRAAHLELINQKVLDMEAGKTKRLLVSMPPRHGKSQLLSIWTPLWLMAKNPRRRLILSSYEASFAANWGRKVRDLALMHGPEIGIRVNPKVASANHWELTAGGTFWTAGVGGAIAGKDADVFILDDPIKNHEDASSPVMREKMWDWFQTVAYTRLEPAGYMIVICTRWHEDDLIGRLELASRTGEGPEWETLTLPALAEREDPLGRLEGEALWPDRFSRDQLLEIKHGTSPYNWSGLYQQRPSPEEGGGVRRAWWKQYEAAPAMEDFDEVIQSWDLAFKDLSTSDYCVGQIWARKGAMFFLLDSVRQRMDMPTVIKYIRNFTRQYPKATAKLIEDSANGPAIIQMLQHEVAGMLPIKTKNQTKDQRLQAVVPLIKAGNVFLPKNTMRGGVRPDDLIDEAAAFPMGTHDDQVDAMSQGLRYLMPKGWNTMNKDWNEALEGRPYDTNEQIMGASFGNWIKKKVKQGDKKHNHDDFLGNRGGYSGSW